MGGTRPGDPGFMAVCPFSWLNNLIMEQIVFSSEQIWQMTSHLSQCLPAEGCGLVGGDATLRAHLVIPIANLLSSPSRFRMDEREQLAAFLTLEEKGLDLIAIYHSHPSGLPVPSTTDITEFFYPESLMIVVSLIGQAWISKAYRINITDHSFDEIPMIVHENA